MSFWKCRIAKYTKKSASFKNTVVLSSHLLVGNMCVLNTNYLFSSVFPSENKNFLVQLERTGKWYHRRAASTLEPAVSAILSSSLTLEFWVEHVEHSGMWSGLFVCTLRTFSACTGGQCADRQTCILVQHCHLCDFWAICLTSLNFLFFFIETL